MKLTRWLTMIVFAAGLSASAQAQTGPLLWNSFIDVLGNFTRADTESAIVSRFTPGNPVTVTRLQLQAAFGSNIDLKTGCEPVPQIKVTDGTTSYALPIPNARFGGPYPLSVHADSGPISVAFPADANLWIGVVQGQERCDPGTINITVQYTVQ
jgi:hypothetical protein